MISDIINQIIDREGGYTFDPDDSGGATKYGITEKVARKYGYTGSMQALTREVAYTIYRSLYYKESHYDQVYKISPEIAERLLEFGILAGTYCSSKIFQRVLSSISADTVDQDGLIGPKTIKALKEFKLYRGDEGLDVLLAMLVGAQRDYLMSLSLHRPKDKKFQYGWQLNRCGKVPLVHREAVTYTRS